MKERYETRLRLHNVFPSNKILSIVHTSFQVDRSSLNARESALGIFRSSPLGLLYMQCCAERRTHTLWQRNSFKIVQIITTFRLGTNFASHLRNFKPTSRKSVRQSVRLSKRAPYWGGERDRERDTEREIH